MEFKETLIYTEDVNIIFTDDEYRELQNFLVEHPKSGDVIKGSGGLRKLRWKLPDSGKSGGVRNIYYYYESESVIYMIYIYKKSKTEDLTPKQIELLRKRFLGE
jgi:hypothetical protein